jgi:hypothetical protein
MAGLDPAIPRSTGAGTDARVIPGSSPGTGKTEKEWRRISHHQRDLVSVLGQQLIEGDRAGRGRRQGWLPVDCRGKPLQRATIEARQVDPLTHGRRKGVRHEAAYQGSQCRSFVKVVVDYMAKVRSPTIAVRRPVSALWCRPTPDTRRTAVASGGDESGTNRAFLLQTHRNRPYHPNIRQYHTCRQGEDHGWLRRAA